MYEFIDEYPSGKIVNRSQRGYTAADVTRWLRFAAG
ncbi:hypothetical protein K239x_54750 [Planctomycetes bacterium K23_9]|uniref:Uncharacterized protein n=1 Tax=Stieleria marina TaxID=1930275 RepID=A0A517P247_9BACT|nr:hypothetical protein K239x_54750 [Planctomycetes bacterium K23_9]